VRGLPSGGLLQVASGRGDDIADKDTVTGTGMETGKGTGTEYAISSSKSKGERRSDTSTRAATGWISATAALSLAPSPSPPPSPLPLPVPVPTPTPTHWIPTAAQLSAKTGDLSSSTGSLAARPCSYRIQPPRGVSAERESTAGAASGAIPKADGAMVDSTSFHAGHEQQPLSLTQIPPPPNPTPTPTPLKPPAFSTCLFSKPSLSGYRSEMYGRPFIRRTLSPAREIQGAPTQPLSEIRGGTYQAQTETQREAKEEADSPSAGGTRWRNMDIPANTHASAGTRAAGTARVEFGPSSSIFGKAVRSEKKKSENMPNFCKQS
jgi:hypothetical protein